MIELKSNQCEGCCLRAIGRACLAYFAAFQVVIAGFCATPARAATQQLPEGPRGTELVAASDATPPSVVTVTPADGATGVSSETQVVVTFSEPVDPATLTADTLAIFAGDEALYVSSSPSPDGTTVSLSAYSLQPGVRHTVFVTAGVTDLAGNPAVPFRSTFDVAISDTQRPSVAAVRAVRTPYYAPDVPVDGAVSLFFTEPLDPATVAANVFLSASGILVPHSTTLVGGAVVVLIPTAPLAFATLHQVIVSDGVTDLAGNHTYPFNSTFTTAVDPATLPPQVVLASPQWWSTVPLNAQVTLIFSRAMNPATITTETFQVLSESTPVPGTVTLGVGGQQATFVPSSDFSVSTSFQIHVSSAAQDLGGVPLQEFSSYFQTGTSRDDVVPTLELSSPAAGATGIALNAIIQARFSKPINPVTLGRFLVTDTGGILVPSAFQVSSDSRVVTFTPLKPLAPTTAHTLSIAASLTDIAGHPVAGAPLTIGFTSGTGVDFQPPQVTRITPPSGAQNVPTNAVLQAEFSEPIDPMSLDSGSVELIEYADYQSIATAVALDASGRILTITPQRPLYVGTQHQLSIGGTLKDLAGNQLVASGSYFTAAFTSDTTPPTVVGTSPANAATGIPVNARVTVRFSESINPLSVTPATFSVTGAGGPVSGSSVVDGAQVIFTPATPLASNTAYTVAVSGAVTDIAGNPLATVMTFAFATGSSVDVTYPQVETVSPQNGDQGVPRLAAVAVHFSEPIDPFTLRSDTFMLSESNSGTPVPATLTLDATGTTAHVTPNATLKAFTTYAVLVTAAVTDRAGNPLSGGYYDFSSSFTTGSALVGTPTPTITNTALATATSTAVPPTVANPTSTNTAVPPTVANPTLTRTPTSTATRTPTVTPTREATATPRPLVTLTGTIHYSGSRGPVSTTRPIAVSLHSDPFFNDDPLDWAAVTTNGGAFTLDAPRAGNYYLAYYLDVDNDGRSSVGEPFEVYNNQFNFPADSIAVPGSGPLDFGDTGLIPGISGTISYDGDQGSVSHDHRLRVQAFTDPNLTAKVDNEGKVDTNRGRYRITTFDPTPLYLLAFFDANGNDRFDAGEPFEIYNELDGVPGDPVVPGPTQTGVNFVFGDQPPHQRLTGTITYTGSRATVSSTTPILLWMFNSPTADDNTYIDSAVVTANGGAFAVGAPTAGKYYLAYVLDLDHNGEVSVGEPAEIYNDRSNFPGDAIDVPQSGVSLNFGDATVIRGIAGQVHYRGQQGHVSGDHPIIVEAFSDALLRFRTDSTEVHTNHGRFDINTLDTNTYYLRAFFDANGNGVLDSGEPFEAYNNKGSSQNADPVVAGANQTAIEITFGDQPPVAHLSGTITYSGSQGPVSNTKPIVVTIVNSDVGEDLTTVTANGGAFDLGVPATGTYNFAYFLDVNNNGDADVGEPFEIYNDQFTPPGDSITAPHSGLVLSFNDAGILRGISGFVTYAGDQGAVSADRPLRVEAFTDQNLSGESDNDARVEVNGGQYSLVLFGSSSYYLRTYFDVNDNGRFDAGEPYQIYNSRASAPADPVPRGATADFRFGDETLTLAGFVRYSGALGPVSDTRPIVVSAFTNPNSPEGSRVYDTTVRSDGGRFDARVGPGTYYLSFLLDVDNDGAASVGEPDIIYNNLTTPPADPIAVPQAGLLNIDFADRRLLSGIAGTVNYIGTRGQVSSTRRLIVQAFRDPNLTNFARQSEKTTTDGGRYDIVTSNDTSTYYLRAFFDLNGNRNWESNEPYEIYSNKGSGAGDAVAAAPNQTGVNITFGDENVGGGPTVTPTQTGQAISTPTPTPTRTPTTVTTPIACVGDCDGGHEVTVDKIFTLLNIVLGNAQPPACPHGIPPGTPLDVTAILKAENNALTECGL